MYDTFWGALFGIGKGQHLLASILSLDIIFNHKLPQQIVKKENDVWIQSNNLYKAYELFKTKMVCSLQNGPCRTVIYSAKTLSSENVILNINISNTQDGPYSSGPVFIFLLQF